MTKQPKFLVPDRGLENITAHTVGNLFGQLNQLAINLDTALSVERKEPTQDNARKVEAAALKAIKAVAILGRSGAVSALAAEGYIKDEDPAVLKEITDLTFTSSTHAA